MWRWHSLPEASCRPCPFILLLSAFCECNAHKRTLSVSTGTPAHVEEGVATPPGILRYHLGESVQGRVDTTACLLACYLFVALSLLKKVHLRAKKEWGSQTRVETFGTWHQGQKLSGRWDFTSACRSPLAWKSLSTQGREYPCG